MNTILYNLRQKSRYFYYKYKYSDNRLRHLVIAAFLYIIFIILSIIMLIFGFLENLIKNIKHGNLTAEEIAERIRLNNIAKENAAASFGQKVGIRRYYQKQKEIREYNNRPWWDK